MFWLDRVFGEAERALKGKIASGKTLLIRDEKTASGRVHIGSMRALGIHAALAERLDEAGIKNVFKYEINDFDPMDGLPVYLDEKTFHPYLGVPLYKVPSPDPAAAPNFAEYFAQEYIGVIRDAGFAPEFYRASELYLSGKMNNAIQLVLDKADAVRKIYGEMYGTPRPDNWYPLSVVCENCGKIGTTQVSSWDGEKVSYACVPRMVKWAEGCGHSGLVSPFDGRAKFPWKIDWPAKWMVMGVDIEGGGKDHYSKGGARDVARLVSERIFGYPEPFGVPNEFFLVGGKKMSSSKGAGSSAREVVELLPPHLFRLVLFGKDINQQINFDPAGDTIPTLWDRYDELATKYWRGTKDDDTRLFEYIHPPQKRKNIAQRFLPRFSSVVFLQQMPHLNFLAEVEKLKGEPLTEADKKELELRVRCSHIWLSRYAPEKYHYELQEIMPEAARALSPIQKKALGEVLAYVESHDELDGQTLHTALHEIRKRLSIEPKDLFGALYRSFLGKDHGPKAGWFLSVLDKGFLVRRLREVAS